MNITLRQIQAFLAVSELGSFTQAADRMHLSQSAVSVLVGELERGLKLKLLDRTTRRVEATEAGRQFGAQAAKIVSDLDHAVRHAHGLSERLHGRLTVFAPPLLAVALLPSAIAAHRSLYPGIAVGVVDGGTEQLVSQVRAGEVDFGIGTLAGEEDDLERHAVAADRLMLFCPKRHALARQRQVPWRAIEGERLITLTWQSGLRRLIEDTARGAGVSVQAEYEVAQITTALAMVDAGLGVAVLPSIACALRFYPGSTARPLMAPLVERPIHVVHRQGRALSPAAQSFVDLLRAELGRMAALPHLGVVLS